MTHYALVIADPARAHAKEIERNIRANRQAHRVDRLPPDEQRRVERAIENRVRVIVGPARQAGDLHAHMPVDCPDGLPNCRNCGDPVHADTCAAAGHCPHCGTRHGIAPAATLADHGYELIPVSPPAADETWDRTTRRFAKRA